MFSFPFSECFIEAFRLEWFTLLCRDLDFCFPLHRCLSAPPPLPRCKIIFPFRILRRESFCQRFFFLNVSAQIMNWKLVTLACVSSNSSSWKIDKFSNKKKMRWGLTQLSTTTTTLSLVRVLSTYSF